MMQLITADYYGSFIGEIAEMHRLRYRVFKETTGLGRPDQRRYGDRRVRRSSSRLLAAESRRWSHPGLRAPASVNRPHHAARYVSRSAGWSNALLLARPSGRAAASRSIFAADAPKAAHGLASATYELFAGMIEFGLSRQLTEIVTVTDARMERILRRAGWPLRRIG